MNDTHSPLADLIRSRRSARQFLSTPIPPDDIRAVLEDAQQAPSNSNTQPWVVHLVSGDRRDVLSRALLKSFEDGERSLDFTADYGQGIHAERSRHHGALYYRAQGIERSDQEGRLNVMHRNLDFYGAPHVALLFMPMIGDGVRAAGDVGMYAQNLLLSLKARGYQAIPQAVISHYADTVRQILNVPAEHKLLFAISFGVADRTASVNNLQMDRIPIHESVTAHDTPGVF